MVTINSDTVWAFTIPAMIVLVIVLGSMSTASCTKSQKECIQSCTEHFSEKEIFESCASSCNR